MRSRSTRSLVLLSSALAMAVGGVTPAAATHAVTRRTAPSATSRAPVAGRPIAVAGSSGARVWGVAVDSSGTVYVDATGWITPRLGQLDGVLRHSPDGNVTSLLGFHNAFALATDAAGNLYEGGGTFDVPDVERRAPDGTVTTLVRTQQTDTGPARFGVPRGLAVDGRDDVYIAGDAGDQVVMRAPDGSLTTVAGGHGCGSALDQLCWPHGLAIDAAGDLFIADTGNDRVVERLVDGTTAVVAGGNGRGAGADQLDAPLGVAVDSVGRVYVADTGNNRVIERDPDGSVHTVVGADGGGSGPDQLSGPYGVAVDSTGTVYIADFWNGRVQRRDLDGTTSTVLGTADVTSAWAVALKPPSLTVPRSVSALATSVSGARVSYTVTATGPPGTRLTTWCLPESGSVIALGVNRVSCHAVDEVGTESERSFAVAVRYAWTGLLQPSRSRGAPVFRVGATVPLAFRLTGPCTGVTRVSALLGARWISARTGRVNASGTTGVSTRDGRFRYDTRTKAYRYLWSTKGLRRGSYRLSIVLGDGVRRTAIVTLA